MLPMVDDQDEQQGKKEDKEDAFSPEGKAGVGPFTIEKAGPLRLRQVLSEPRPKRRLNAPPIPIGPVLLASVAAAAALFAACNLSPDADATATQLLAAATEATVTSTATQATAVDLDPIAPTRLTSPDGEVTVDIGAGAVDSPVQLLYEPRSGDQVPALPSGYSAPHRAFELSVEREGQPTGSSFAFSKPVTVSVALDSEILADMVGRPLSAVVILKYVEADNRWHALDTEVDLGARTASAFVNSLSIFALALEETEPTATPSTTVDGTGTSTPSPAPETTTPTEDNSTTTTALSSAVVTRSLPDLVVTGMRIAPESEGGCFRSTDVLGLIIGVANRGDRGAGPFTVVANGLRLTVESGLARGESTTLWIPGYARGENSVFVDATFRVEESDDDNNELVQVLAAPERPPECRPTASSILPTATPTPAAVVEPQITLHSLTMDAAELTVVYSKNFSTCAHLVTGNFESTHVQDHFCQTGTRVEIPVPVASFSGVEAGVELQLCHGNDSRICSRSGDVG